MFLTFYGVVYTLASQALFLFSGGSSDSSSTNTSSSASATSDSTNGNDAAVADDDDDSEEKDPFPSLVLNHDWLEKSPVDEPHPNQWEPPERLGDLVKDAEWNSEELIPFLNQFDKHSKEQPGTVALTWIGLNGEVQREMTYADLQAQSNAIAIALRTRWGAKPGDRVMIVYPPGFDFLVAFLGCIRAREYTQVGGTRRRGKAHEQAVEHVVRASLLALQSLKRLGMQC